MREQNHSDFYIDGTEIVIPDVLAGETCKLVYWPRITRLTQTTLDTAEIGVPDNIAVLIPYYIKGDLYRNDDPNEAGEARNWFEAGVSDIVGQRAAAQGTVHTVFSQTWG